MDNWPAGTLALSAGWTLIRSFRRVRRAAGRTQWLCGAPSSLSPLGKRGQHAPADLPDAAPIQGLIADQADLPDAAPISIQGLSADQADLPDAAPIQGSITDQADLPLNGIWFRREIKAAIA